MNNQDLKSSINRFISFYKSQENVNDALFSEMLEHFIIDDILPMVTKSTVNVLQTLADKGGCTCKMSKYIYCDDSCKTE